MRGHARDHGVLAEGLGVSVDGRSLLTDVDLTLEPGQPHAFVGERLAGKTVLLRALVGLWPASAQVTGHVACGGVEITGRDADQRRAGRRDGLLYLPAAGRGSLNPIEQIGRQVEDVWRSRNVEAIQQRGWRERLQVESHAALRSLGIGDPERVLAALPDELSGGMNKRVLLAMALLLRPRVLAADEPTAGLDVTIQRQILDLLAELQRQEGFTLLVATQDLGIVAHYARTITVLERGRIVEHTTPDGFFSGSQSRAGRSMLERVRAR